MTADQMKCCGCGIERDAGDLDAVLLDSDGNEASCKAYCETCHPAHATVPGDVWRPNSSEALAHVAGALKLEIE